MMPFIDMETTGLEAYDDVPLELGIVLCNDHGKAFAEAKWLVWEEDDERFQKGVRRGRANEFVNPMHEKSGLWDDLKTFDTFTRDEVDAEAVAFLKANGVEERAEPMCGNSIGSLDRPFALLHFPKLNAFLSYRNIDLSSVKELCKRTNPALYKNLEPIIGTKADATHRVLEDCYASIREYQAYLDNYLIVGDDF